MPLTGEKYPSSIVLTEFFLTMLTFFKKILNYFLHGLNFVLLSWLKTKIHKNLEINDLKFDL